MRVLQQRPDRRIWLALHACSQKLQISFGNRDRNFAGGICARQRVHHQDGRCGTYFASAHRRRQFRRNVGVEGLLVRVTTICNANKKYTDKNGKVTFAKGWYGASFRTDVRYIAKFKTDNWKLFNPQGKLVENSTGRQQSWWAWNIGTNPEWSAYATVHRGLHSI